MSLFRILLCVVALCLASVSLSAQTSGGIDPEALIERILAVDKVQRERVRDVSFDAEYVESEDLGNGETKEKVRFEKEVFVKYLPDTAWYAEKYLAFYADGQLKSESELKTEAADRMEKKKRRSARDISFPMLKSFYPSERAFYEISYVGIASQRFDDRVCHQFRVAAKQPSDSLINGDFYFEAENFHLVRVDFTPSKLVKRTMFKLKSLDMSITYGPNADDIWLPRQFEIHGKGKAMFFIGVDFAGTEYYRNPRINTGLSDSLFEESHGN